MKNIAVIFSLIISLNLYAQQWQVVEGEKMPYPVYGAEAVVIDSLIYIIGGYSDLLKGSINLIQEYDPENSTWRVVDSINTSRVNFVAGNYNDSIIIAGGVGLDLVNDSTIEFWNRMNQAYVYDLSENFIRTSSTGLVYNDILYVFGGDLVTLSSTYMYEYDIPSKTIMFNNNFDFPDSYPYQQTSALAGESIYLFGGVFLGAKKSIYRYDIQNKTLDLLRTELLQSRAGSRSVTFSDSLIYVIGGLNETNPALSTVEVFEIDSGSYNIATGPELNVGRSELMAVNYNNMVYVFGGKDDAGSPVSQVERLEEEQTTDIQNENNHGIKDFKLYSNYPNPFNPSTMISFYIPSRSSVKLIVYDITGKEINMLINDVMEDGSHEIIFNTSEGGKSQLSSGIYFYRLTAFNFSTQKTYIDTRKMVLLK
jgi:N-acetylneuraminic acid mutarotase